MQLRSCQFLHSTPELEHLQGARASVLAHTKPSQHGRTQRRFLFPRDYCISVSKPRFWVPVIRNLGDLDLGDLDLGCFLGFKSCLDLGCFLLSY
jgi:hypothetical protein